MINRFFPFLVYNGVIGTISPVVIKSTDGASEIANHKGRP